MSGLWCKISVLSHFLLTKKAKIIHKCQTVPCFSFLEKWTQTKQCALCCFCTPRIIQQLSCNSLILDESQDLMHHQALTLDFTYSPGCCNLQHHFCQQLPRDPEMFLSWVQWSFWVLTDGFQQINYHCKISTDENRAICLKHALNLQFLRLQVQLWCLKFC